MTRAFIPIGAPANRQMTVSEFNGIVQTANNVNSMRVRKPLTISNTPNGGITLGINLPVARPVPRTDAVQAVLFSLVSAGNMHLNCVPIAKDGTFDVEATPTLVARPWLLRNRAIFARDGWTYTPGPTPNDRDASPDDLLLESESHFLLPKYLPGDEIWAVPAADVFRTENQTDLSELPIDAAGDPVKVRWLDENPDSRYWAWLREDPATASAPEVTA